MNRSDRSLFLGLACFCATMACAQTGSQRSQADVQAPEVNQFSFGKDLGPAQVQSNSLYWDQRVQADEQNAYNWFQYYQAIRQEGMLNNNGALPQQEKGKLAKVATELNNVAPGSFEDHYVQYQQAFPSDAAFDHLAQANSKNAMANELLGASLADALVKNDPGAIASASKALYQKQLFDPGLLAYGQDLLKSLEPAAIIVVAGEMDGYPMLGAQHGTSLRNDVTIVDRRLLDNGNYRSRMWQACGATGSVPNSAGTFLLQLPGNSIRPTYFALTLDGSVLRGMSASLYPIGLALRYSAASMQNLPLLEKNWNAATGKGKQSHLRSNYLLPGAILLRHYIDTGDLEKEKKLRTELEAIANATGRTQQLKNAGVLK